MQKINVLLLSNDDEVRQQWLKLNPDVWNVCVIETLAEVLQQAQQQRCLVLADASMVDIQNSHWQQLFTLADVIVGSLAPNDPQGQKMIVAGAKGYFHAYSPANALHTMLQHVQSGHIWIGQDLLSRLISQLSSKLPINQQNWKDDLTPREIEIVERVALGHANQLIADDLNISERTVRAHLSAVFEKLNVSDRLMLTLLVHGVRI